VALIGKWRLQRQATRAKKSKAASTAVLGSDTTVCRAVAAHRRPRRSTGRATRPAVRSPPPGASQDRLFASWCAVDRYAGAQSVLLEGQTQVSKIDRLQCFRQRRALLGLAGVPIDCRLHPLPLVIPDILAAAGTDEEHVRECFVYFPPVSIGEALLPRVEDRQFVPGRGLHERLVVVAEKAPGGTQQAEQLRVIPAARNGQALISQESLPRSPGAALTIVSVRRGADTRR
jgi:hypothetical protein